MTDTNDNPPVFLEPAYSFDIPENAKGSQVCHSRESKELFIRKLSEFMLVIPANAMGLLVYHPEPYRRQ